MSFHTTIARLREAAAARVKGEAPGTCRVQREDLRVALHVIDRLDSELRQAGVLTQTAAPQASALAEEYARGRADGFEAARDAPQAGKAMPGCLLAAEHVGMCVDYNGLLGQARSALRRGENAPAMAEMLGQLAVHLTELGQRWYAGDAAVVDELLQLYCIESDARAALSAQPGAQKKGVSDA